MEGHPLANLIEVLPITEKLVPPLLTVESTLYFHSLTDSPVAACRVASVSPHMRNMYRAEQCVISV